MSFLVYHAGALGDFITTLPLIAALRGRHADAHFVLLARRSNGELAVAAGYANEAWDIDDARVAALFATDVQEANHILDTVDSAVVFAHDDSPVLEHLRRRGVSPLLSQPPFPQTHLHVVDYHLSLAGPGPWTVEQSTPRIEVSSPLPTACRSLDPGRTVLVHAGSGSAAKNWPSDRFAACAEALEADGFAPVWLMGPVELERGPQPPRGARVLHGLSAAQLAPLLQRTTLFVGNDSGVAHLAAACGCPTVAVFGATDPGVWGPRGRYTVIVVPPVEAPLAVDGVPVKMVVDACAALARQSGFCGRD